MPFESKKRIRHTSRLAIRAVPALPKKQQKTKVNLHQIRRPYIFKRPIDLPVTHMLESPTPLLNNAVAESSQGMGAFDEASNQFDLASYRASGYEIQPYSSFSYDMNGPFDNAGGLSPQATRAVEKHGENPYDWNFGSHDVDMFDEARRDSGTMLGDLTGQEQPGEPNKARMAGEYDWGSNYQFQDVEMDDLGSEISAREEGRSGEGKTWDLPPGRQTSVPLRGQAGGAFVGTEQEGAPSSDDDKVMGEDEADKSELQREVEPVDEEESEDEREASPKMGEDGAPADAEGGGMGGKDGDDEESRRNRRMEALRRRPTASSTNQRGKVIKQPIRDTSSRRSKGARTATRPPRKKSKPTIEDEGDADADATMEDADPDADGSVEPEEAEATEDDAAIYDKIADGIWIKSRRCNLDVQERPKIQCHTEIEAYGISEQKISIQVSVHVRPRCVTYALENGLH